MQALGMRFGAHVNAHTSFDETVYQLQIPTDNPAVIDRSLLIMEDWAHNVSFDPAEVDKERGVSSRSGGSGLGADARLRDAQMPILLKGARYAERSPIGRPEIIRNVSPRAAEAVLHRLVSPRPDGGDRRRRLRSGGDRGDDRRALRADSRRRRRRGRGPIYTVPPHAARSTRWPPIARPRPRRSACSADAGAAISAPSAPIGSRWSSGCSARLLSAGSTRSRTARRAVHGGRRLRGLFVRTAEVTTLTALVPDGGAERGSRRRSSPRPSASRGSASRDRARAGEAGQPALPASRRSLEKDKSPSAPLADEFVRHVVQDEPVPGIVYEQAMSQRFLPEITLEEVNALARTWMPDGNRVVVGQRPERAGLALPTRGQRWRRSSPAASKATLSAYVDRVNTQPLLAPLPTPGHGRAQRRRATAHRRHRVAAVERRCA